jgi:hypothetical protein
MLDCLLLAMLQLFKRLLIVPVILATWLAGPQVPAHSPIVDSLLNDWCVGTLSNRAGRIEDTAAHLSCGHCSESTGLACEYDGDCFGETCVNQGSKTEIAWWDNRTDAAVNDLATVAATWDNSNLYFAILLWSGPDPVSLPFFQIAIDYDIGGVDLWHDPLGSMVQPGTCSGFTDRHCTTDVDCFFCQVSTEPFPSTRVRACGSGCDPDLGDVCDMSQTCVGIGALPIDGLGLDAGPPSAAEHLMLFDLSLWLVGAGDATLLMEPGTTIDPTSPWDPVTGCTPDFVGDNTYCDFPIVVNPGTAGGPGGPPGSMEVQFPWEAFGCTGCPAACSCPGLGPGVPFRFTMTIVRGALTLDYRPAGAHEDTISESVGGATTTSRDDCAGFGIGNTDCELADGTTDGYIPRNPALPHESVPGGRTYGLTVNKAGGGTYTLDWFGSCSAGDDDYEIYEGLIGSWTSHLPILGGCSTGGATTANVPDPGFNAYYLVVPTDGATEGSYGESTVTGERSVSTNQCRPRRLGNCP